MPISATYFPDEEAGHFCQNYEISQWIVGLQLATLLGRVFGEVQCFNSINRRTTIPSIYICNISGRFRLYRPPAMTSGVAVRPDSSCPLAFLRCFQCIASGTKR